MKYRSIAARLSFGAFAVAAAIALIASAGTRLHLWDYTRGLEILLPAVAIGLVAALAGVYWLAAALRNNNSEGWRWGTVGLIGATLLLWTPVADAKRAYSAPPIHDISTDVEYAPAFQALLPLRKGATNGPDYDGPKKVVLDGKITTVAELQKKAWPDIKPVGKLFNVHGDPSVHPVAILFWRAFERAKSAGWNIIAFDAATGRIEATDTTAWFGFTDDIVVRVQPAGAMGARLDIRSKARVGTSDYGRNAERVREFLKGL